MKTYKQYLETTESNEAATAADHVLDLVKNINDAKFVAMALVGNENADNIAQSIFARAKAKLGNSRENEFLTGINNGNQMTQGYGQPQSNVNQPVIPSNMQTSVG